MAANKLVINAENTHLIVMGTKATAVRKNEVTTQAGKHIITPTRTEKLLGGYICENLKWREHLVGSEQSLARQLTSRLNGLVKVSMNLFICLICSCKEWWFYPSLIFPHSIFLVLLLFPAGYSITLVDSPSV